MICETATVKREKKRKRTECAIRFITCHTETCLAKMETGFDNQRLCVPRPAFTYAAWQLDKPESLGIFIPGNLQIMRNFVYLYALLSVGDFLMLIFDRVTAS